MQSCRLIAGCLVTLASILGVPSVFANTLVANIADYNAAKVASAGGQLTVPAGLATYSVTGAGDLAIGSTLVVKLPTGFTFSSAPSFTTTGTSTFALTSGGVGSQSATFTIGTADLTAGQSVTLATFNISGATALETLTPVASALPISIKATSDASALTAGAFASEPGVLAIFVGAIQFIDNKPPADGTEYGTGGTSDSLTAVMSATAISAQSADAATSSAPVLNPDGTSNTISPSDKATVVVTGQWQGIIKAFSSSTSSCSSTLSVGTVTSTQFTISNVPVDQEVFFCVTANGTTPLQPNPVGQNEIVHPGASTDFLTTNALVEFPGFVVLLVTLPQPAPLLGVLASLLLAASLLAFGARSAIRRWHRGGLRA